VTTVQRDRSWVTEVQVCPSILAADFGAFRAQVRELMDAGARTFHVDVMDGHFVPVITFGHHVVAALADEVHDRGGALAVHLMVERPERFVDDFARAGADGFTVHVESTVHLHRTLQLVREAGMVPGVTLNPATPVALLEDAAREADNLLCMSVNPGWGGQAFK
jgi:ribulose-phosphate 3-epimerase